MSSDKMKLKTLKDIEYSYIRYGKLPDFAVEGAKKDLKTLAIKWVKEDEEVINRLHIDDRHTWIILLQRWMNRLNISDEDLK